MWIAMLCLTGISVASCLLINLFFYWKSRMNYLSQLVFHIKVTKCVRILIDVMIRMFDLWCGRFNSRPFHLSQPNAITSISAINELVHAPQLRIEQEIPNASSFLINLHRELHENCFTVDCCGSAGNCRLLEYILNSFLGSCFVVLLFYVY